MEDKELLAKLESFKVDLLRTKTFLPVTEAKMFQSHMDDLDKEIKRLQDGSISQSIKGGLGLYLEFMQNDVKDLIPRMRSPYKEGMQALVKNIAATRALLRQFWHRTDEVGLP
jgi:hypothetical protein|tara:strand:- start:4465 stop:4803 length:339 start_codon:yes stop_codon:yes gene_type:complete